jgi:murein DD-endopeptidase MepM/ murein hydrolase activator NlpD
MNLLLKVFLSFLTPIYAHTDIKMFESSPVQIQWQNYGENYQYMVEVYDDINTELIMNSNWLIENSFLVDIEKEGLYLWNLYIKEKDKECSDDHQCLKIESGYFYFSFLDSESIDISNSNQEEKTNVENTEEEKKEIEEEEVLGTSIQKVETQQDNNPSEEVVSKNEEEKIILDENSCIYKYNIKKKEFYLQNCNIQKPKINSSTYSEYDDIYIVNTSGSYSNPIDVRIDTVTCRNFDLFDPKTWFNCEEVFIRSDNYKNIELNYEAFFLSSKVISPYNYIFEKDNFKITGKVKNIPKELLIIGDFSLKHNDHWLDQEIHIILPTQFKEVKTISNGEYAFPFSKIVYVNQWHGCTDYQCPHKGIDFASIRENIYASNNGVVISKGYDTYSGECNSGGNYLVVKYDGGHHMAYLHLEKTYVNVNQKVKKGELIALSGNSGSHNCQPLGYHLHFELREKRSQSTHINPVPFIDINWDLVKTNKANIYPKRLSGDNPHPNF